eukprot:8106025-Pyramimonas_sp.AAC.1
MQPGLLFASSSNPIRSNPSMHVHLIEIGIEGYLEGTSLAPSRRPDPADGSGTGELESLRLPQE